MPVQFSQTLWLEVNNCGGDGLGDWEVGRVNLSEFTCTAWNLLSRVLVCAVNPGGIAGQSSTLLGGGDVGVEDVWVGSR